MLEGQFHIHPKSALLFLKILRHYLPWCLVCNHQTTWLADSARFPCSRYLSTKLDQCYVLCTWLPLDLASADENLTFTNLLHTIALFFPLQTATITVALSLIEHCLLRLIRPSSPSSIFPCTLARTSSPQPAPFHI